MATFPSRPRSAAQNAARLRDNQRRHRARVKAHIAELEARLAETTARLDAALAEVEKMRRDQAIEQPTNSDPAWSAPERRTKPQATPSSSSDDANQTSYSPCQRASSREPDVPRAPSTACESGSTSAARPPATLIPPIRDEQLPPLTNPSNQPHQDGQVDTAQPDALVVVMPLTGCDSLPAPHSGESTMTCLDAYGVIKQQNFSGLDVATITNWLKPGFRKAAKPGGACRVDTQLLFALLDYISSCDGR